VTKVKKVLRLWHQVVVRQLREAEVHRGGQADRQAGTNHQGGHLQEDQELESMQNSGGEETGG
jgi:hypothetical protein